MLTKRTLVLLLAISILNIFAFSQNIKDENSKQLEQKAVGLLRETIADIHTLKSSSNRLHYTLETASLLWKYDEKEARKMFEATMSQIRISIAEIQSDMKKPGARIVRESRSYEFDYYSANRVANTYSNRVSYATKVEKLNPELSKKVGTISMGVSLLISKLLTLDPVMAYTFYKESHTALTEPLNYAERYPDLRPRYVYGNLELLIVEELITRQEKEKAVLIGGQMLSDGYTEGKLNILWKLYTSFPKEGGKLAENVLASISKEGGEGVSLLYLRTFLGMAEQGLQSNPKMPLLDNDQIKRLARIFGKTVLAVNQSGYSPIPAGQYANMIQKYAPDEAVKIRKKFGVKRKTTDYYGGAIYPYNTAANALNAPANKAMEAARRAANAAANAANSTVYIPDSPRRRGRNRATDRTVTSAIPEKSPWELRREAREKLLEKLKASKFSSQQRQETIIECRRLAISDIGFSPLDRDGSVPMVGGMVEFAMASSDKELANDLMNEAASYITPNIANIADYASRMLLAIGYSESQPDKAFSYLESMAPINDVITSSIKLGEFVDVDSIIISNGEANFSIIPIQEMAAESLSQYGTKGVHYMIVKLAKADFERTKSLASKFERAEFRVTAKMLIIRSILDPPVKNTIRGGSGVDF